MKKYPNDKPLKAQVKPIEETLSAFTVIKNHFFKTIKDKKEPNDGR